MLDQLLNEASRQTKDAVAEASTPPPIDQLLLSRSRPISVVAWKGPLVALGAATAVLLIALLSVVLRSDAPSDQPTATLAPEPPVTAAQEATIPEREVLDSAPATEPPGPLRSGHRRS